MRIVPARSGWRWLGAGFALYRRSPAMWLLLVLAYWVATETIASIPYLGVVISTVLLPAFSMSFMAACAALEQGAPLALPMLFAGFRRQTATLISLGGLYLLALVAILALASLADGGALAGWMLLGNAPDAEAAHSGSLSLAAAVAALLALPLTMAFWFAPVLAAWEEMSAAKALFFSFFATLRNWRALAVYAAALALLGLAVMIAVSAFGAILRGHGLRLLFSAASLAVLPAVFGSFYASYRDVFPNNRIPAESAPPADRVP